MSEYSDELAELALGVLTGRERAQALSHVESCPRCAEELEQLSRVADTVVQVAPEAEPPMGFEVRLFERMGVADERPARRRVPGSRAGCPSAWRPPRPRWPSAWGLGLAVLDGADRHRRRPRARTVTSAKLVENGETVGHVVTFGGDKPWMSMMLADSSARGKVELRGGDRRRRDPPGGTFDARKGYGAWIAPLHVDPAAVRTAEVVSPSGTVIATATLG